MPNYKCTKSKGGGNSSKFSNGVAYTVAFCAVAIMLSQVAKAQWMAQRIELVAGWNAVHLKVNPADARCESVFSDARIAEVTWWNRDRISDGTGTAIVDSYNWYRDPSKAEACTFGRVVGDQCYLVYSTSAVWLDVIGTPAIPRGTIYLGESNLVGVNVNDLASSGNEPTYYEYFRPFYYRTPSWYEVSPANTTVRLSNSARIRDASKAVWLDAEGSGVTTFTGPFLLSLGGANAAQTLSWTDDATKVRTLKVRNDSSEDRVLRIERASSLEPPSGFNRCVGNVELLRETIDWSAGYANHTFVPMSFPFVTNIAAGATFELNLRPDTSRMAATAVGDYMSILVVSDKGSTIAGESRPDGTCLYRVGASSSGSLAANAVSSAAGLWVGTVVLGEVNRAKMLSTDDAVDGQWDSTRMLSAPHPFQFRLLVHVDASRNAKILKEVFAAKATAEGDTVLLTDRATAIAFRERYSGGTIRRTSSANFPFAGPIALSGGTFMDGGDTLTATVVQPYDDRTNPFVHSFHPQHDNVAFNNMRPSKLGSGDEGRGEYESWGVTRQISLTFDATDSTGAASPDIWNRTVTGGTYEETVHGLTGQDKPIKTRGIFRLSKVNDVPTLITEVIP